MLALGMFGALCGIDRNEEVAAMVHRIDNSQPAASEVSFFGLLDAEALTSLAALRKNGGKVRLVLRAGTTVVPECISGLLALDFVVTAESPYLARWLERARADRRRQP
jgi:hypothetical protein